MSKKLRKYISKISTKYLIYMELHRESNYTYTRYEATNRVNEQIKIQKVMQQIIQIRPNIGLFKSL